MTATATANNNNKNNDGKEEASSIDQTLNHVWIWEPQPIDGGVLTKDGLENIAHHQYKPGSYTALDRMLNPVWTWLTETLLPMNLAPNMVTTLGGFHCGLAYGVSWYYSPNFNAPVPSWVLLLNGYCTIAYYTLDCMDGKQARRTNTSSPLGQLFDHGFDCICNLAHVSSVSAYMMTGGTYWYLIMQTTLQFAFFMAQWEEYYTHVLPHSTGNIGVTEVNYGLGLMAIANAFIHHQAFWTRTLGNIFPEAIASRLPSAVASLQLRHAALVGWCIMTAVLVFLSFGRVFDYVKDNRVRASAVSKLFSALLLALVPFYLPYHLVLDDMRYISVAIGMVFSLITKKIIVFSMAKASFAVLQLDVVPLVVLCVWLHFDENITELGASTLLSIFCLWHAYRLVSWAQTAIHQICDRLDINCFTIKKKKES